MTDDTLYRDDGSLDPVALLEEVRALRTIVAIADAQLAPTFAPLDAFAQIHDSPAFSAALLRAYATVFDIESSASRQHWIDTGRYLPLGGQS